VGCPSVGRVLLTPRYDGEPVLRLEDDVEDPAVPVLRQRRRLGAVLAELDEDQWSIPSRCEGWTVRDVVAHLAGTNQFWEISASAGLAGAPTRFLAAFDPVATPAEMVDRLRSESSADVLTRYQETTEALAEVLSGLDEGAWATLAEAPPGHVALSAVAAHALWDAWIHERDVLLPLGIDPVEEPDEVATSLRYAAALGPSFGAARGTGRQGILAVHATDPDVRFVVEIDGCVVVRDGEAGAATPLLAGRAVDLLEGLSFRVPLQHDLTSEDVWLLGGLDEVFDRTA
jgi:uncharacterized protein (TIGR03083 family)